MGGWLLPTYRQRIFLLHQEGRITKEKQQELLARVRHTDQALGLVKTKLDENYNEFRSRAYEVAHCRGKQHRWNDYEFDLGYRPIGCAYTESELCERCGKICVTIVNAVGQPDRKHYIDPPNFALPGVKTTKSDWKALARYIKLGIELDELEAA